MTTTTQEALRVALKDAEECFEAAFTEGLREALDSTTDERLKDLVERRLLWASMSINTALEILAASAEPAQAASKTEFVQTVPDHCDRIVWRNAYFHLPLGAEPAQVVAIPEGWQLVPKEPTESMVTHGFESAPDRFFDGENYPEEFDSMTGCQKAAFKAKRCYQSMLASAPSLPQPSEQSALTPAVCNAMSRFYGRLAENLKADEAAAPAPVAQDEREPSNAAERFRTYLKAFSTEEFDSLFDSVDRQNLATALDNLEDAVRVIDQFAEKIKILSAVNEGLKIAARSTLSAQPVAKQPEPQSVIAARGRISNRKTAIAAHSFKQPTEQIIGYCDECCCLNGAHNGNCSRAKPTVAATEQISDEEIIEAWEDEVANADELDVADAQIIAFARALLSHQAQPVADKDAQDAKRYRWLKMESSPGAAYELLKTSWTKWDEVIDAIIASQGEKNA